MRRGASWDLCRSLAVFLKAWCVPSNHLRTVQYSTTQQYRFKKTHCWWVISWDELLIFFLFLAWVWVESVFLHVVQLPQAWLECNGSEHMDVSHKWFIHILFAWHSSVLVRLFKLHWGERTTKPHKMMLAITWPFLLQPIPLCPRSLSL